MAFHPKEDIVAAGLIEGNVACHRYTPGQEATQAWSAKIHKESCRALDFSVDGNVLYSASKDQTLQVIETETGKVLLKKPKAHSEPINALQTLSESLIATGDDGGCVKIWDTRQRKVAMKYHENVDFISDMTHVYHKKTLLVTSGDGCLSVFDIRKQKPVAVSANQDDELLCVQVVRNTTKAVVGTQDGTLLLFSWGDWGDCTDRFPGHPASIDSMVKMDDNTVMTASGDGILRAIGILPNRLIGAIDEHNEMPVERIRMTRDGVWVGSCAHDATVRFWNAQDAMKEDGDDGDEDEAEEEVADEAEGEADDSDEESTPAAPSKPSASAGDDEAEASGDDEVSDDDSATPVRPPPSSTPQGPPPATKRPKPAQSSSDDSDSDSDDEKEKRKRQKKAKKAKRGIGGGKKGVKPVFSGLD
ncbi:WD40-repeat-containing domain protein [Fimicolochytrium jonesii]|uniref:WD40-repeat-containing domain protein n=1 Tax=Fimicolochytrium jonesii TaxID=1396493 RepID=UPI0022FE7960|nr:WD40-repeat-containing domain protein [Fimicolochytrium jonesii]KAI8823021.1 WD40-repeat-containing domain protein [Fimicolochytrium jonesii]